MNAERRMIRGVRAWAASAGTALILAACSSSPSGSNFCELHLPDFQHRISQIADGTMTDAEAVDALAESQASFEQDALASTDPVIQATAANLARSVGHLKVAISGSGDLDAAIREVNAATDAIPDDLCTGS